MFGMPNVGAAMCNFAERGTDKIDEYICARYFQLSIVSPLAVFSDRQTDNLDNHPFNFKSVKGSIKASLKLRADMTIYMREQLKGLEIRGGTLLRPIYTEFPSWFN